MSGPWEQYVEKAALVLHRERFGPDVPWGEFGPVMEEMERAEVRAVLATVGPLIQEDTRERMVAAAGAALEREEAEMGKQGNDWGGAAVSHHRVTAYTVYPSGYDEATFSDKYMYALTVEERGENAWAVKGMFEVLNSSGEWEREPSPSNRDDDFLTRCRFTEEEALRLASEAVDGIRIMNRTIGEADAEVKIRTAEQAARDAEWRAAQPSTS